MEPLAVRLMRGGTSKGVFMQRGHLERACAGAGLGRDELLLRLMGSPDPSGLQLDGLGGGISSTSKVGVMAPTDRGGALVEYQFAQVALRQPQVDWTASCGNLAAAAGLFALEEGMVDKGSLGASAVSELHRVVPVWQANAGYLMHVHVPVAPVPPADWVALAGIPGKAPPVHVEVVDPCQGQPRELFPTGNVRETLALRDGTSLDATLLWAANPIVFVEATSLGLDGLELPDQVPYETRIKHLVQDILAAAAERMGTAVTSAMRVCWVSEPRAYTGTTGEMLRPEDIDIVSRITTEGRVHHAHTVTGALNLGIACAIPGTIPALVRAARCAAAGSTRVGHPAGVLEVSAKVADKGSGLWRAERAGLLRTARTLLAGQAALPL